MNIFKLIQREPKMTKAQMVENIRLLHATVKQLNKRIANVAEESLDRDLARVTDHQLKHAIDQVDARLSSAVEHFSRTAEENK
jgi:hypothetical protein